jgi:hypothetical protein
MGAMGKKFCLILDIDKVLSADEILAVTDAAANEQSSGAEEAQSPQSHFGAGA